MLLVVALGAVTLLACRAARVSLAPVAHVIGPSQMLAPLRALASALLSTQPRFAVALLVNPVPLALGALRAAAEAVLLVPVAPRMGPIRTATHRAASRFRHARSARALSDEKTGSAGPFDPHGCPVDHANGTRRPGGPRSGKASRASGRPGSPQRGPGRVRLRAAVTLSLRTPPRQVRERQRSERALAQRELRILDGQLTQRAASFDPHPLEHHPDHCPRFRTRGQPRKPPPGWIPICWSVHPARPG